MQTHKPHKPRKRFGQNFLNSAAVVEQLLGFIKPRPDDVVVEIGPGRGALTDALLSKLKKLTAIEIDHDLANQLKEKYSPQQLQLHTADVLDFDFSSLHHKQKIRIVGNLPYNISTPLLFHLFNSIDHIQDMHFMLQRETVQRLTAEVHTKHYSRLSVMAACYVRAEHLMTIDAAAFLPPPKVVSAFVRLMPQPRLSAATDREQLAELVSAAFGQRRKQLQKIFAGKIDTDTFRTLGINPHARAETLSLQDFLNMLEYARL